MSEIRTSLLSNLAGTGPVALLKQWASKAWMNLNGSGTIAIRDSENTSSVTDNGTGSYTQNFTSAMANANFSVPTAEGVFANGATVPTSQTVNGVTLGTYNGSTATDSSIIMSSVFGDLA